MDPATAEHLAFCETWTTECGARDARDTGRPTRPDAYVIAIRYPKCILVVSKCMQCFRGMHARWQTKLLVLIFHYRFQLIQGELAMA